MSLHRQSSSSQENLWELDLRDSPPGQHPSLLFECLDRMGRADHLLIDAPYEPEQLRWRVEAWCADEFRWSPVSSGPDIWQAEITRRS